ncbi:hypothetical protein ScalyP_jg6587, partial [Parmales sp. scaly parma]
MWSTKYAPTSMSTLAVHKAKVTELESYLSTKLLNSESNLIGISLLVIAGPPGIGKSAAVRTVAASQGIEVLSWNDQYGVGGLDFSNSSNQKKSANQLDEFEEFLRSTNGYSSLATTTTT